EESSHQLFGGRSIGLGDRALGARFLLGRRRWLFFARDRPSGRLDRWRRSLRPLQPSACVQALGRAAIGPAELDGALFDAHVTLLLALLDDESCADDDDRPGGDGDRERPMLRAAL